MTLLIGLILFFAAWVRASIGFGDSVIAMSLLALFLPISTATPLVALAAASIGVGILWGKWKSVDYSVVWRLLLASAVGVPFGLYALTALPEQIVKSILGLLIATFALYSLTKPKLPVLKHPGWSYVTGCIAGVLGGAYNINGPPIVIFATLCRWPAERFIATMQGFFLPTGVLIVIGHGLSGKWTTEIFQFYLWSMPGVVVAILLGNRMQRWIKPGAFDNIIYTFLLAMGSILAFG